MAEIKITEKRQSNWLPWLLGVVVLAAIIWFVAARNTTNGNTAARSSVNDTSSAAGTLAEPRDSMGVRVDSMRVPPPR